MHTLRKRLVAFLRIPGIRHVAVATLRLISAATITRSRGLRAMRGFTVMQVGGREGSDPVTHWLRLRGRIRTVGVEPESTGLAKMRQNRSYDVIVPHAFGGTQGTATLHITQARGWCSLLEPDELALQQLATPSCLATRPFRIIGTETMTLTTLDAIAPTLPEIHFLQIDVQGAELQVLQGATETLRNVWALELEAHFYPIYKGEPRFTDIHAFLEEQGFRLIQLSRQGEREFGDTYVETNACYANVRLGHADPTRMAMIRQYATAKHHLYGNPILRLLRDLEPTHHLHAQVVE